MVITSHKQVSELRSTIFRNAQKSKEILANHLKSTDAVQLFALMKYDQIGIDPLMGEKVNLIEQINQMYSDLVVLAAVQDLLDRHPGKSFVLHLGTMAGYDVESTDGQIVAECFAVTSVTSNDKLNKDCHKLLKSKAEYKYVFFYTYKDSEELLEKRYKKYPEIHFERVY